MPASQGLFFVRPVAPGESLRAYPNNPLYCGRLQSPMPAPTSRGSQRGENHASEHFWPAALAFPIYRDSASSRLNRDSDKLLICAIVAEG